MAEPVSVLVAPVEKAKGLHYRNPRIPLNIKLPDNLECGTKIYIHGAVANEATRFSVNLKNAEVDANTYFHFNPRFGDESVVVRNSRLDGVWGSEEREGENPFTPGATFFLLINPTDDGYEVQVNGNLFTVFNHRSGMPLCDVTYLTLKGDITLFGVHLPLSSLPVPLSLGIPGKTCLGDMFYISGSVPGGSDRFAVNLQCGSDDSADIMFHLNPRFGDGAVVCNSRCSGSWDSEEREGSIPISPGDSFTLCLCAAAEAYHVFINGTRFIKFNHRLNMGSACTLSVNGDISLSNVALDCPPSLLPPESGDKKLREYENASLLVFSPEDPFTVAIPDGLEPGKVVVISGDIPNDPSRFRVNLQCSDEDGADVAMHFNPRWDQGDPVLVLNARDGGGWGEEVREPNHIIPDSRLELCLICRDDGYCITVNGDVHHCFPHRLDCRRVNHVSVKGSIDVHRLVVA